MAKIISVIVPTMWYANELFFKMLPLLEWSYAVGEIIIVDNNPKDCPHEELAKHNKILRLPTKQNLFFNPSINLGAKVASNEILCFLNDDVIFDPRVFEFIAANLNDECGMISPHPDYFNRPEENEELIKQLHLNPLDKHPDGVGKNVDGFGCSMFVMKKNFEPVPSQLVHHFGDEFISKMQEKHGRVNQTLHNWTVITPMRVTTRRVPEVQQVINNDWSIATQVFAEHGLPNPIR